MATRNQPHDELWISVEGRWTFARIEHAQSARRAGPHIDQSPAMFDRVDNCVHSLSDANRLFFDRDCDGLIFAIHQLDNFER